MNEKFNEIFEKALNLQVKNPEEALKLFESALELAQNSNNIKSIIDCQFEIGVTKHNLLQHRNAVNNFINALELLEIEKDIHKKSNVLRCLAVQYIKLNKVEKAINTLYESKKFAEECNFIENLNAIESALSSIYVQLKMPEKALEHSLNALKLAVSINDKPAINYSNLGVGSCYLLLGEVDNAEKYLLKIIEDEEPGFTYANTCYILSKLYYDKKEYIKAIDFASRGYDISKQYHIIEYQALCCGMMGTINLANEEYQTALEFLNEAIAISEKYENKRILFTLYNDLIKAYEVKKDYKNMAEAYEKLYNSHIEFLEEQNKIKIKQITVDYELEKAKADAEIERLKNIELSKALNDIKKLNEKLEELNIEKNNFMAIAVHDLKNPLLNILSTAKFIKRSNPEGNILELSDNIIQQTDRMFALISKILSHNSIEEGNIKISKSKFKPDEISMELFKDFVGAANKKNINIITANSCNGSYIYTDYDILYQILSNLISNAIKFTPINKNIYLKTVKNNGNIIFEIDDEGPGFTDEDKQKVFKKFAKLSAKPTNGESSTGLGLSIAKKLAEKIQAELILESSPGQGSKLILEIPEYSDL
jgi:signal transduction histidine kinase